MCPSCRPLASGSEPRACSDAGKARAPGPEVKQGRADLSETLLQLSNPYKDGRTLGDQWLEARGKQRVPGPEMRRGRRVRLLE